MRDAREHARDNVSSGGDELGLERLRLFGETNNARAFVARERLARDEAACLEAVDHSAHRRAIAKCGVAELVLRSTVTLPKANEDNPLLWCELCPLLPEHTINLIAARLINTMNPKGQSVVEDDAVSLELVAHPETMPASTMVVNATFETDRMCCSSVQAAKSCVMLT